MGIIMITISQISAHTALRVYPRTSPGNPGLELALDQRISMGVVLRDDERGAGAGQVDPLAGRDPHRQLAEHLVDLGVVALVDADPACARGRLDPRVRERPPRAIAT